MKTILALHASYFIITGLWPFIHISSFLKLTGSKKEIWLVKMVGLLAVSFGIGIIVQINSNEFSSALFYSVSAAVSFAVIDTYYVMKGAIRPVYLADALIELLFAVSSVAVYFSTIH